MPVMLLAELVQLSFHILGVLTSQAVPVCGHRNVIDVRVRRHCVERGVGIARREFIAEVLIPEIN